MAHRACESGLGKESPRDNCRRQAAIVVQISSRNMQIDGVGQPLSLPCRATCGSPRRRSERWRVVTKVRVKRGSLGSVHPAMSRGDITQAVHDNIRNLGVEVLDVVNMRSMLHNDGPAEGSLEAPLTVLADLQHQGLVRYIGLDADHAPDVGRSAVPLRVRDGPL
jgi:hypothetical protein